MRAGIGVRFLPVFCVCICAQAAAALRLAAQEAETAVRLTIGGAVSTPLVLTREDLKKMPRKTVSVVNPHNNKTEVYERRIG